MNTPKELFPLLEPLIALHRLLSLFDQRGVVIGGVASSLLGKPRLTADIDVLLLLSTKDIPSLIDATKAEGFEPRIANMQEFAVKNRVLLFVHSGSNINLDITLGILPFEEEIVQRSTVAKIGDISLRLPTPEDLIIMKAVAHRPKDLLDIQAVFESNPGMDKSRIQKWVKEFAEILESPEIWEAISRYFNE